jgi:hypothetical protein
MLSMAHQDGVTSSSAGRAMAGRAEASEQLADQIVKASRPVWSSSIAGTVQAVNPLPAHPRDWRASLGKRFAKREPGHGAIDLIAGQVLADRPHHQTAGVKTRHLGVTVSHAAPTAANRRLPVYGYHRSR